jgi:hypothetical protein
MAHIRIEWNPLSVNRIALPIDPALLTEPAFDLTLEKRGMYGKAVKIRHCPATVNAENLSNSHWEGSPFAPDVGVDGREDPGRRFKFA